MSIFLICGIPASGKTTFCSTKKCVFSFDNWLKSHYKNENVEEAGWAYINDPEGMDAYLDAVVKKANLHPDTPLYVDDGAVERSRRMEIIAGLKKRGIYQVNCIYILCPMYEAAARNIKREWPITREIFYSSCTKQEYPKKDEGFASIRFIVSGDK